MQPNQRRFSECMPARRIELCRSLQPKISVRRALHEAFQCRRTGRARCRRDIRSSVRGPGSLPACLNVTDDSEPSVWFSLEGLSLRTRVAHDETALFLSNTTFSPDGMLGSTAGVPQSASASAMHSGIAISPRSAATIRPVTLTN
jgi:hypothetical protein